MRLQFTSLGWTSNPTETVPTLCLLPPLQTRPCPGAMELEAQSALPVINQTRTLARRQPQPQSQRKQPRSSYFIYNLLTTEWKLIEAAGSKWLPVCQHQMAAPALTPLDRSSLTLSCLSPEPTGCYGFPPPCFPSCQVYVDALPLLSAELLLIRSSENTPRPPTFMYLLYTYVC